MATKDRKSFKYVPYYGKTGFGPVVPRIGFKPNIHVITNKSFEHDLEVIRGADCTSLDTETTSLKWDECQITQVNIGMPGNVNYIGFYYTGYFGDKADKFPTKDKLDIITKAVLSSPRCYMWNRYFDQRVLIWQRGFVASDFWKCIDGMNLLWLMDTNVKRGLGLKPSAKTFLGITQPHFVDLFGNEEEDSPVGDAILTADWRRLAEYGAYDAYTTLELGQKLYYVFKKYYPFMLTLHVKMKNALFSFEEQHQVLDANYLNQLNDECLGRIEEIKNEFYEKYGFINLGSSRQKSDLLMRLGYSTGHFNKPAKDGTPVMSTKAEYLQTVVDTQDCDPARLMIEYNVMIKLYGTYVATAIKAVDSGKPFRFHFLDARVPTLRLASGQYKINKKPYDYFLPINLQAVPKPHSINRWLHFDVNTMDIEWHETEQPGDYYVESGSPKLNFRRALCADPGCVIVKCDFAAEELRVAAALSKEPVWLKAFAAGTDPHRATASNMWHISEDQVDGNRRKKAKISNFGLLYDGNAYTLQTKLKIPKQEAEEFYISYVKTLRVLYAWKEKMYMEGRTTGSIKNMFGFERRVYSYYRSASRSMRAYGDRTCISQAVQGLCGVLMRIIIVKLEAGIYEEGGRWFNMKAKYGHNIRFVDTVHDENDFSVPIPIAITFMRWLKATMESVTPSNWPIKLQADPELGLNMGEMFEVNIVKKDDGSYTLVPNEQKHPAANTKVEVPEKVILEDVPEEEEDLETMGDFEY